MKNAQCHGKYVKLAKNIAENLSLLSTVIRTISIPKSGKLLYQTKNTSEKL